MEPDVAVEEVFVVGAGLLPPPQLPQHTGKAGTPGQRVRMLGPEHPDGIGESGLVLLASPLQIPQIPQHTGEVGTGGQRLRMLRPVK